MRNLMTCLVGAAALALTGPALADAAKSAPGKIAAAGLANGEVVPTVLPGDDIAITCDALAASDANSDVRVVLTISAMPGESKAGIKRVMATNEEVTRGAVRVRVPQLPALDDRTVNLDVYVVDEKGSKSCDAGHVKIADQILGPAERKKS